MEPRSFPNIIIALSISVTVTGHWSIMFSPTRRRKSFSDGRPMRIKSSLAAAVGKVVLENSNSDDGRENTSSGPMNEKLKRAAVRPPEPGWGASQITQKSVESGVRPGVFSRSPNSLGCLGEFVEPSL